MTVGTAAKYRTPDLGNSSAGNICRTNGYLGLPYVGKTCHCVTVTGLTTGCTIYITVVITVNTNGSTGNLYSSLTGVGVSVLAGCGGIYQLYRPTQAKAIECTVTGLFCVMYVLGFTNVIGYCTH